jgi:enoyl-CoA hydratase/carnithine racemase
MSPTLITSTEDARGVVQLRLNRPDAFNAMSSDMLAELQAAIDAVAQSSSARVVVLSAAGKAFCAGHDLLEMRANPSMDFYKTLFAQCSRMMLSLQALPVPVVAQVDGVATAAGCQLVGMCDLAVASTTSRFAVSGINLGLFCATPSVALTRNLPRKAAFEMLMTGAFISAQDAQNKGLINIASTDVAADTERLVASILAKPRVAVAMGKQLFYQQLETSMAQAYQLAENTMACNMMDPAAQEGVQAFIDKRAPNWSTV